MATLIAWTDETWNPTTGCTRVSEGCRHCYAEALSLRFGWSRQPWTKQHEHENIVLHPERLRKPYTWTQPKRVFVNSMSDLFHPLIPDAYIAQVFAVMADTPQHQYQVLTKRPERAATWEGPWPKNIWLGTSVEDRKALHRIDALRASAAQTRFLSCEPLLEDLGPVDLTGVHWVIVGGESGKGFRPMPHRWARSLRDQCVAQDVAFFFKQSAAPRTEMGIALEEADGSRVMWRDWPDHRVGPQAVADK